MGVKMRRKTLDMLLIYTGALLTVVLVCAGSLLMWGYTFTSSNVHNQLADQKIFFPAKGSPGLKSPLIGPFLDKYAGQQMVNGAQAEAWADHYIAVHLKGIGGGLTYAELSAKSMADPTNTVLAGEVQTVFRGETLRGMLLNAYAFGTMGMVALYSAIATWLLALVMLILTLFGVRHYRQTDSEVVV